jgi:hypothetical protein
MKADQRIRRANRGACVERETGVVDARRTQVRLAPRWSTKAPVHEK